MIVGARTLAEWENDEGGGKWGWRRERSANRRASFFDRQSGLISRGDTCRAKARKIRARGIPLIEIPRARRELTT